jgi:UDP-N-acetylglucosamine--N-acetylmuramyl-(pentapeptide) pyrophosphoryl-undecaprenol N-acetylglucosamine transferase
VKQAYEVLKLKAIVRPFFAGMDTVLGAATAVVSRAGASSLAELAAMRVSAVLVPYPAATDNHQFYNAQAYVERGAACLLEQKHATPEKLAHLILGLSRSSVAREKMQSALAQWHTPRAAEEIARAMLVRFERPEFAGMESMTGGESGASSSSKPFPAGRGNTADGGLRRTDVNQKRAVTA